MPLHFEAARGSAVDHQNGLVIYQPRIEPRSIPDEAEYQYPIYRGEKLHGIGFFGICKEIEEEGQPTQLFTMDLGQAWVLDSILELKQQLEIDGDDFDFMQQLADGFVKVFQSRKNNREAVHYLALTQEATLLAQGIRTPHGIPRIANGQLILAELRLPARPMEGAVP